MDRRSVQIGSDLDKATATVDRHTAHTKCVSGAAERMAAAVIAFKERGRRLKRL